MTDPTPYAEAAEEELARALHRELCGSDPDEMIHGPAQNSWEEPGLHRWEQWVEAARAALAAMPDVSTLLAANQAQAEELKALREAAARIVSANADTHERGLRDQIDNSGRNYQSQFLADAISDLIALLHPPPYSR